MSETRDDLREALARAIGSAPMENADLAEPGRLCDWLPNGTKRTLQGNLLSAADAALGVFAPILAQVSALQAEVERWKTSFDGHVYVTDADFDALCRRAERAEAEVERLQKVEGEREKGRVPVSALTGEYPSRKHSAVKAIFVAQFHSREEGEKMWADLSNREPWFGVKLASAGRAVELLAEEGIL